MFNDAKSDLLKKLLKSLLGTEEGGDSPVVVPHDPNDKIGPTGYGAAGFITATDAVPYRIDFVNASTATASAEVVTISDPLPSTLDPQTVQLGEIVFGSTVIDVPAGQSFYTGLVTLASGVDVEIVAGIDPTTDTINWTLTTIDPTTGQPSTTQGFLPPDDSEGDGEGYVTFTVNPLATDPTGTVINNQATITFDTQPPMTTDITSNTIDAVPPSSTVAALPATTSLDFTVSWSGSDDPGGSGLAGYDIYVSVDDGSYTPWLVGTTATSATYDGALGNSYSFYSISYDNAGNVEATPEAAEATTTVASSLSISSITPVSTPTNTAVLTVDVTFSEPINTGSLSQGALTLTDNNGVNLINSGISLTLVSGTTSTYAIGGLGTLTEAEGNYTLIVNAADIQDQNGISGSGTLSISWLMDTTPPTSSVDPLAARGTSLSFAVSVTGTDPEGANGSTPSGVASYDIYVAINGGSWSFWTNVPASHPTATYTGQSNTTYSFYSIAHDLAGNIENKKPLIEASTYLPDLTPPVTTVDGTTGTNPSSVNSSGTFTLDLTGDDPGGAALSYFEVFVSVDGGTYQEVGAYAIPAGFADSQGNYHSTMTYQGLTDGQSHSYSFYSIGLDALGNLQSAPSSPNVTFSNEVFSEPSALQVTGFTVEHGSSSRSYIRYLDLGFNESDSQSGDELTSIVDSVGTSSPDIQIYKYDLAGDPSSKTTVPLSGPTTLTVIDHAIEIDFGSGGIGGSPNTTAADGYYEVDIKLPNGQIAVHHFYRLLGDVAGDEIVDQNDLNEVAASIGQASQMGWTPVSADVNGDGSVGCSTCCWPLARRTANWVRVCPWDERERFTIEMDARGTVPHEGRERSGSLPSRTESGGFR